MFKQDWQAVADEAQRKAKARKAGTPKKDEKKSTRRSISVSRTMRVSVIVVACAIVPWWLSGSREAAEGCCLRGCRPAER